MCKVYGYCRVSTANQNLERQIRGAKHYNENAIIITEKASASKDIKNRPIFLELLSKVKSGDTIVFDEVSRMSRQEEGYQLYMELMAKGVNLVFLKERHIDTEEYKKRANKHIERIQVEDTKIGNLINGILSLVEEFELENLKDNIRLAFERAEAESKFIGKRIKDGKEVSENRQGKPKGTKNKDTEQAADIKKIIKELSQDFNGQFSDAKIMREYIKTKKGKPISRNTYYKYKKELAQESK